MPLVPTFFDCGDSALLVEFGRRVDKALSLAVLGLSDRLARASLPGVRESIPAFSSLTVLYDPSIMPRAELAEKIAALCKDAGGAPISARSWTIPVFYGGALGPDLGFVAVQAGLSEAEVIELHSAQTYFVYMLGFLPGFAYLGDLPPQLRLARKSAPRARLPAGSVAIAAEMTAIYPLESPGGWHLIGATPIRIWDIARRNEPLLRPGDSVRFQPVSEGEWENLSLRVASSWAPTPEEEG